MDRPFPILLLQLLNLPASSFLSFIVKAGVVTLIIVPYRKLKLWVMKKSIFIAAIVCFTLFACKTLKPDFSKAASSAFNEADSIPSATAHNMITHFTNVAVDHSLDSIIKQVSLFDSDLYAILKTSTKNHRITRIRLLAAAYLDTDTIVARRNHKTVLVQLKIGYNSDYYYYDIQSFGDGRLCPPPPGCSSIE